MMCSMTLCTNECAHVHVHLLLVQSTSANIFSPSVEMSSLLVEICSRQEAWMEMRTGTLVDPPQDTGTTGPHPAAQEQM